MFHFAAQAWSQGAYRRAPEYASTASSKSQIISEIGCATGTYGQEKFTASLLHVHFLHLPQAVVPHGKFLRGRQRGLEGLMANFDWMPLYEDGIKKTILVVTESLTKVKAYDNRVF